MRELTYIQEDQSWVIGEWKDGSEGNTKANIQGRVYHINKDFRTLYIGYMLGGKRHGWGAELPIYNSDAKLPRRNYFGQWKQNKKVINEENDVDEGKLFRNMQKTMHNQ